MKKGRKQISIVTFVFICIICLLKGNIVNATYKIKNNSNDVGANLSLQLTNSNDEYFKVIERIEDKELQAGDTTTQLDYYIGTVIDGTITRDYESGEQTFPTYSRLKKPFENSSGGEGTDSYWLRNASFEYEEGMFRRIMGGSIVNIYANQSAGFVPAFRIE